MNLLFIIRGRILIKKIICFLFVILFLVSCNNFKSKNFKNGVYEVLTSEFEDDSMDKVIELENGKIFEVQYGK